MNYKYYLLLSVIVIMITSCGPKYTASFGPSQKFYQPEKESLAKSDFEKKEKITHVESYELKNDPITDNEVIASKNQLSAFSADSKTKEIEEKFKTGGKYDKANIEKLSTKDKKTVLKEAKKDIKALKKQSKITNQKIYVGLIVALAGLVVAILASGALGGLAIIVGVVLIVWGLIEQGSL